LVSDYGKNEIVVPLGQEIVFNKGPMSISVSAGAVYTAGCDGVFRTDKMVTPVIFPFFCVEFGAYKNPAQNRVLLGFLSNPGIL
jgi:hypothetical protein